MKSFWQHACLRPLDERSTRYSLFSDEVHFSLQMNKGLTHVSWVNFFILIATEWTSYCHLKLPLYFSVKGYRFEQLKVRGYVTRVKGWTFKMFFISTRLPVNNHRSFFFYLNICVFRNVMSFGNKRRYLATTASKPCFALYVIYLVARGVFSMSLVLMYSAEWSL